MNDILVVLVNAVCLIYYILQLFRILNQQVTNSLTYCMDCNLNGEIPNNNYQYSSFKLNVELEINENSIYPSGFVFRAQYII